MPSRGRVLTLVGLVAVVATAAGCASGSEDPDAGHGREGAPTRCDGTIGADTVGGDLLVPRDRTCRLEGTAVDGRTTVEPGGSLVATSAYFGEGIGAHSFRRVELREGSVDGREDDWTHDYARGAARQRDYLFVNGGTLLIRDGDPNGSYHVHDTRRRVVIVGVGLDLGRIFCAGNRHPPVVRDISGESPGKLGGQCAGPRRFGETDF